MEKSYFREVSNPSIKNPLFVLGLPGLGNVGKIAANLLIKFLGAKPFAEYYSPFFPDYVTSSKGICHLPRYVFYAAQTEKTDFIVMTGDIQPSFDDVVAHYMLCDEILEIIAKRSCSFIITMGGIPQIKDKIQIYVAATSAKLAKEFVEKGALLYDKDKITGVTGLLLGFAKERDLGGVCLLGTTSGLKADRGTGFSVFKFVLEALSSSSKEGL